jgi:hypothetical protein
MGKIMNIITNTAQNGWLSRNFSRLSDTSEIYGYIIRVSRRMSARMPGDNSA